jgi:hypothetical protein
VSHSLPIPTSGEISSVQQVGQVVPFVPQRKTPQEAAEEFFASRISNENTREAYTRDAFRFAAWC